MQKCLLVANKATRISEYLERRALYEIVEERTALSTINIDSMDIIDVDLLLYIYYKSDDSGLGFRSDMNMLRKLLQCSFFHVDQAVFIMVDDEDPLRHDLIGAAIRSSSLTSDHVEIIDHKGSLMLEDVAKYLSGGASGADTTSTYQTVYITEADVDEHDRFQNDKSSVRAILPVLTDSAQMYKMRARTEALSSGRMVVESNSIKSRSMEFSQIEYAKSNEMKGYVFSGNAYTGFEKTVTFFTEYCRRIGQRTFVINLTTHWSVADLTDDCEMVTVSGMRQHTVVPNMVVGIDTAVAQLGYVVQLQDNVPGIDNYVFLVEPEEYDIVRRLVSQLCDKVRTVFVTHFAEDAVKDYIRVARKADTVFLSDVSYSHHFDVTKYRNEFAGVIVALFKDDDIDYSDFYSLVEGDA